MAIYQRGKSYYYDFVYKGQRHTGNIGPVSRTTAKEEEIRKKREVIEGILNPSKARKSPRFDVFAQEYLEWVKANKKPLTYKKMTHTLARIGQHFGQKRLNELTPWHLEQYKKTRREAGKQASTINVELAILKAMLHKAHAWNKLGEPPTKTVKPLKGVQGKTRFLSEEEAAALLAACSPTLRRVFEAGLLTGFRRQELASLRPEDLDFQRGTVTVAACYSKNGESRTVPMGARLKTILQDALTIRGEAPTVFVNRKGEPWTPAGLTEQFRRASLRAGLERLGPHVLRHTFASRLVMAGVDLRTVQELMGHKNVLMTARYAHLSPDHKRAAIDALERRFSEKSPVKFHNVPLTDSPSGSVKVLKIHEDSNIFKAVG